MTGCDLAISCKHTSDSTPVALLYKATLWLDQSIDTQSETVSDDHGWNKERGGAIHTD